MSQPVSISTGGESRWGSYFCLALAMTLTGMYVSLCKPLGAALPVFLLAWLRFCIAAVAMLHWLPAPAGKRPLSARTRGLLFLQSFFGNFLFTICMLYGLRMTSTVSAGIILACIPAAVALLSRVFLRERIAFRTLVSIALSVGGIALLSLAQIHQGDDAGHPDGRRMVWVGDLLVLVTVFCEAAYVVIGKKLTEDVAPRRVAALINLCGLALFTLPGLYEARTFDFALITPRLWGLLLFYALAASIVCVWLWMTGLKRVPASQSGVFTVMLPVGTALTGVLLLNEPFTSLHSLAFVLAIAGLVLATTRASRAS